MYDTDYSTLIMKRASSTLALRRQMPDGKIYRKKWKACKYGVPAGPQPRPPLERHGHRALRNGGRAVLDLYQEYSPEGIAACGNTYYARRSEEELLNKSLKRRTLHG